MAADLRHVKALLADAEWAHGARATEKVRDQVQDLLRQEKASGRIATNLVAELETDPIDRRRKSINIKVTKDSSGPVADLPRETQADGTGRRDGRRKRQANRNKSK
eukprot:SAG31_NODE_122_length_23797_cov_39.343812_18_plen_106_part_00